MKLSYECEDIINELLQDIDLYSLDEPCVIFKPINHWYFTDYLLKKEFKNSDIHDDEQRQDTTLFNALCIFIEQNSILTRSSIAYKLLAIRNIAGLSQREIADQLDMDAKNYAKWETGDRNPKLDALIKIANICKIDIKYLL